MNHSGVVLRPPGGPGEIVHRSQDGLNLSQQLLVERFFDRADISLDVGRVGSAENRRGYASVGYGELKGELTEIRAASATVSCCLGTFESELFRRGVPPRRAFIAQQAHCQRSRVEERN